jgi:hypothetical protein
MRNLLVAIAMALSSVGYATAGEPSESHPPECVIAIFFDESSTTVCCPTGTPLSVISAIANLFADSPTSDVNLHITRFYSLEPSRSTRWILLHMSEKSSRMNVSSVVPWDVLPSLVETIASFGYSPDVRLIHVSEIVNTDANKWKWIVPGVELAGG